MSTMSRHEAAAARNQAALRARGPSAPWSMIFGGAAIIAISAVGSSGLATAEEGAQRPDRPSAFAGEDALETAPLVTAPTASDVAPTADPSPLEAAPVRDEPAPRPRIVATGPSAEPVVRAPAQAAEIGGANDGFWNPIDPSLSSTLDTPPVPAPTRRAAASFSPAAGSPLMMTSAEQLTIRFHGYTDISGEYRINDDETVSVPVIGRVSVANRTASELEAALAERVTEFTGRESDVTVEVDLWRPVFVTGLVDVPGSHAWRRGMSVLQAVTLSGGFYRNDRNVLRSANDQDGRFVVAQALAALKRGYARRARLEAEMKGVETLETPEVLERLVGPLEADALIAAEQNLYDNFRAAKTARLDALNAAIGGSETEIARLEELTVSLEEQLEARRAFVSRLSALQRRGVVTDERVMELEGFIATLEERLAGVRVSIARAQATRLETISDRIELEERRSADLNAEIIEIETEIEQRLLSYESAVTAYQMATFGSAEDSGSAVAAPVMVFEVVRMTPSGPETRRTDQFAALLPGDIVVVRTERAAAGDEIR